MKSFFIGAIAFLIGFSALTKGAHDIWAATLVYVLLLLLLTLFLLTHEVRLPLLPFALVLVAALVISFLGSANPSESFLALMDWVSLAVLFYLSVNILKNEKDVLLLVLLLTPVFLAEGVVVVIQWFKIKYLMSLGQITYEEPVGTFVNGNSAVAFSLLWLPALTANVRRWYAAAALVALLVVLLLVSSAWSAFCLLIGLSIYLYDFNRKLFWGVLVVAGAAVVGIFWYKLALIYGWGNFDPGRIAPTSRLNWWLSGIEMWKDHPWFGVGLGNFPSAYLSYKTGAGQNTLYAHSFIVQLLAETGLVGLGAVIAWIGACLTRARGQLSSARKPYAVGLLMFLVFSSIQVSFEYLSHLLVLGLFAGILVAPVAHGVLWRPPRPAKIVIVGAAVAALPFLVSPFLASRLLVDGRYYMGEQKWDEARKSFEASLELDDRAWEPYWGLAEMAAVRGNFPEAIRFGEQALERNKLDRRLKEALEESRRRLN